MTTTALGILCVAKKNKSFEAHLRTCVSLLKNLSDETSITEGTVFHGHLIKTGLASEKFIAVRLLLMYLNRKKHAEVDRIMEGFHGFDLISHNCLISANVQWGNLEEARRLFDEMPVRNGISWTTLISGFMKHGRVDESMWYFHRNPFQDVVSWTAAISGLVQIGLNREALELFLKLLESEVAPNSFTFSSIISACSVTGDFGVGMSVLGLIIKYGFENYLSISNAFISLHLRMGEVDVARRIFDNIVHKDVVSWTMILDVYVQMGDMKEARRIFEEMPEKNEISWSAIIARFSQTGGAEEAYELFRLMILDGTRPNISCASSLLSALAGLEALQPGITVHTLIVKIGIDRNVYVGSSLIDLYCKCGKIEDGRLVFDSILDKNVVLWNSLISGYSLNGRLEDAENLFQQMPARDNVSWNSIMAGFVEHEQYDKVLQLFNNMIFSGETPSKFTFSSVLCACASLSSLDTGRYLHAKSIKHQAQFDVFVGTALTDMYAKSGDIGSARKLFHRMPEKNESTWTVIIQGLAENGFSDQSLLYFREMERTSHIVPNDLIFLAVLFACSHCGLVEEGLFHFNSMERIYGIKPSGRHYTCIVDLLSRSGRLTEAEEFLQNMPFEPEANAWAALLSGCKTYKNEEIAVRTARKLWSMAGKNSAGYVLLSNVFASAGKWYEALNVRKLMREKGLKKSTGSSSVEVRNQVHSFCSDSRNHPQSTEIEMMLELLHAEMLVSVSCSFELPI